MEKIHKRRKEILEGDITRTLIRLALPLIFINMIQILYNLADTFWLGKLGKEAVSAPAVSWPVIATLISFGAGFVVAGLSLVSQYFGAAKYKKMSRIVGNLYFIMFTLSIFIAFVGYFFSKEILEIIQTPSDILDYADSYMSIILLGVPFAFSGFVFSFTMRAIGDMMTPVKINLLTILLNVVLDPLLIFGLGPFPMMGVGGAAIATVISNTLASLIGLYLLISGFHGIKLRLRDFMPDVKIMKKIFGIGIHASFGNSLNNFGMIVMISIVNLFGSAVVAAYGIVIRVVNIFFSMSMGIGQAMATMVGQNIGAKRYDRVKKIVKDTLLINFSILLASAFIIFIIRYHVVSVFIKNSEVIFYGIQFISYYIFSIPFFALFGVSRNALRASGQTKKGLLLGLFKLWILRIPLVYFLAEHFNSPLGIWIGMSISNVISGIVAVLYLFRWTWIKRLVE